MDIFILGRINEGSFLLYDNKELTSQRESEGNVYIIFDTETNKGFLHTGKNFIDFVKVGLLPNNQCYFAKLSNRYIYSVSPLGDSTKKTMTTDRTKVLGWEAFDLMPIPDDSKCKSDEIKIIIECYFTKNNNFDIFKRFCASNLQEKSVVLESILKMMTTYDFEMLSGYYHDNKDKLEKLANISEDSFFIKSVKQLTKNEQQKNFISEDYDFIADKKNLFSMSNNIWMHLNCHIRKKHKPNKKFCVVATAKNEGIYLLEWIAYYQHLGVHAIFIYSNGNDDGSDELLKALHNEGVINYIENKVDAGCSAQNKAYTHALTINQEILDYEWSLFIDLDEYLVFNESMFTSVSDFLDWHHQKDVHAIALNWIFSIPTIEGDWINTPITKRIKNFENSTNGHIKSIFRPHFFSSSLPHHPVSIKNFPFTYRTASGETHSKSKKYNSLSISDNPSNTHAAILHFFNRSIPEFIWKYSRNRGDHPNITDSTSFTESVLPFLKNFSAAMDSTKKVDSSLYFPKNLNIDNSIHELLKSDQIHDAYIEVKNRTKKRYDIIYDLFWEFLEEQKKQVAYTKDIESFIDRFS